MTRTRVTETPKPEAPPPITLLRVEERTERVDLDDAKKVERMAVAVGMLHTADALFDEAAELTDEAKNKKKSAEAKREEGKKVLFDAQNGQALQPYPVIVERHPVRPAEMLVWRVADGMAAGDLLELEPTETPRTEEEHFAAREAQGCTLLETRAMSPEELEVAREADQGRLPFPEGGEPTAADAKTSDEPGNEEEEDGSSYDKGDDEPEDDDEISDPEDSGDEEDNNGPTDGDDTGPTAWKADEEREGEAPAKKHKPANPNVIARLRIALNGLAPGAAGYSMPELADRTGHHADDIKPAIEQLLEEGFAVKTGKARGTRYGRAPEPVAEVAATPEAVDAEKAVDKFIDL